MSTRILRELKAKGYTRTIGVRSSNPYAAAAVMGKMMGLNQSRGPYFSVPLLPAPAANPLSPCSGTADRQGPGIKIDLQSDWGVFLEQSGMAGCGLEYDQSRSLAQNTLRYLNAHDRRIPRGLPRTIHESRELCIPGKHAADFVALKALIRGGGDLKPHLSRKRPDKNDGILNAWGLQHLHFRPEGTEDVLLCKITHADVFLVQVLPHGSNTWVDTSLLQILHDNWPEQLAMHKVVGISAPSMTADERRVVRNENGNFFCTMSDGTVYLAPGGGLVAAGNCQGDVANCDRIFTELAYWEGYIKANEASIRAALNWLSSEELVIKMMFGDDECFFFAPATATRFTLRIPLGHTNSLALHG